MLYHRRQRISIYQTKRTECVGNMVSRYNLVVVCANRSLWSSAYAYKVAINSSHFLSTSKIKIIKKRMNLRLQWGRQRPTTSTANQELHLLSARERDVAIFYRNMFIFGHSLMDSSSLIFLFLSLLVCVFTVFAFSLPFAFFSFLVFGGCAVRSPPSNATLFELTILGWMTGCLNNIFL